MGRYQVKFNWDGEVRYGVVRDSWKNNGVDEDGRVVVDDAILPRAYRVPESEIIDIEDGDEYYQYIQDEYRKAREISDALPDGLHVGAMFSVGVADGEAFYVVTRVTKTTASVQWRGFNPDRYTDHYFGWGKTLPREDVERYVEQERALAKLFSQE